MLIRVRWPVSAVRGRRPPFFVPCGWLFFALFSFFYLIQLSLSSFSILFVLFFSPLRFACHLLHLYFAFSKNGTFISSILWLYGFAVSSWWRDLAQGDAAGNEPNSAELNS
ncbi:hypothetical protein [Plesiomonas shigelloides]|uniref:hypothetical protein n=1 Tax=Plesiomonas shigelloides TaxID=703 RepID=UPI001262625C|nr:hypothetical protein [Plesiomonas shigelloides]KAB7659693.1 hypothetical protein GBN14_03935 [Plesiomonas shigelloides]